MSRHVKTSNRLIYRDRRGSKLVKVYHLPDTDEYRLKYFYSDLYRVDADYYTDDKEDALATAMYMLSEDEGEIALWNNSSLLK